MCSAMHCVLFLLNSKIGKSRLHVKTGEREFFFEENYLGLADCIIKSCDEQIGLEMSKYKDPLLFLQVQAGLSESPPAVATTQLLLLAGNKIK